MPDDRLAGIRARLAALPDINFASTSPEDCYGEPLPEGQVADLRWCLIDRDEDDPALAEGWRPIIEWMATAPADVAWLLDQYDQERAHADRLADAALANVVKFGWPLDWTTRHSILVLEAGELADAIRGKHGDPTEEAADVLLSLFVWLAAEQIAVTDVMTYAQRKVDRWMTAPIEQMRSRFEPRVAMTPDGVAT